MNPIVSDIGKCFRLYYWNFCAGVKNLRERLRSRAEYVEVISMANVIDIDEYDARLTRVLARQRFWEDQHILCTASKYFPISEAKSVSFGGLPILTDDARATLRQQIRNLKRERLDSFLKVSERVLPFLTFVLGYVVHRYFV